MQHIINLPPDQYPHQLAISMWSNFVSYLCWYFLLLEILDFCHLFHGLLNKAIVAEFFGLSQLLTDVLRKFVDLFSLEGEQTNQLLSINPVWVTYHCKMDMQEVRNGGLAMATSCSSILRVSHQNRNDQDLNTTPLTDLSHSLMGYA